MREGDCGWRLDKYNTQVYKGRAWDRVAMMSRGHDGRQRGKGEGDVTHGNV